MVCDSLSSSQLLSDVLYQVYQAYNSSYGYSLHQALGIPSLSKTKQQIDLNVDVSMDIEALTDDAEAIQMSTVTDFDAGNVVGKLMVFIAQLWQCSEDTRKYLKCLAVSYNCPPLKIKIWVHTQ